MELTFIKTATALKCSVSFSYKKEVIPFRCRNPRFMSFEDGICEFSIPVITKKDAPVAIIKFEDCIEKYTKSYRFWNGKLYASFFRGYACGEPRSHLGKLGVDGRTIYSSYSLENHDTTYENILEFYSRFVMIDGKLYKEVTEPMYVIMTFGLGCNHGGTALMDTAYYNSNIPSKNYYRLDELTQALKAKDEVARGRGDTDSVGVSCSAKYRIIIPEAIQSQPKKDYTGEGDSFLNKAEALITTVKHPWLAHFGLLAMCS